MSQPQIPVAEIVTFRLQDGTDPDSFQKAARQIEGILMTAGTATSRTLSCDADGQWTDHIIWTSMEAAKSMADRIMSEPAAAPMMQMIDPATVSLRHAEIHYQME